MRGFSKVCLKFAHNLSKTAEDDYTFYEHFKKNRTVQKIHEYHPNILKLNNSVDPSNPSEEFHRALNIIRIFFQIVRRPQIAFALRDRKTCTCTFGNWKSFKF